MSHAVLASCARQTVARATKPFVFDDATKIQLLRACHIGQARAGNSNTTRSEPAHGARHCGAEAPPPVSLPFLLPCQHAPTHAGPLALHQPSRPTACL